MGSDTGVSPFNPTRQALPHHCHPSITTTITSLTTTSLTIFLVIIPFMINGHYATPTTCYLQLWQHLLLTRQPGHSRRRGSHRFLFTMMTHPARQSRAHPAPHFFSIYKLRIIGKGRFVHIPRPLPAEERADENDNTDGQREGSILQIDSCTQTDGTGEGQQRATT